jgi:hypothetical protein
MHDHAKVFHDVQTHAHAARVHIKHGYIMYADAVRRYNTKTGFRTQATSNITVGSLLKRLAGVYIMENTPPPGGGKNISRCNLGEKI